MGRALVDRQPRVDHRVIQRGGHLTDAAADAFDVVAVGDFQRRLIAVGRRALERNLVEGDGLAGGDGQAIEALRADADIFRPAFNVVAGFADGGFKAAELHDLRFQLGARDRGLHGNRGQIDHAAFQHVDHRADALVQPGDIQRLPGRLIRIGERRPLGLVVHARRVDGGEIHLGFDLGEDLVDLTHIVGERGIAPGRFFFEHLDLLVASGGRPRVADGPELIELVGDVILHVQAVAGDIPTAAILRAQGDFERGNQRLHLLGDERRRLVERLALKRDVVDVDVRVEHAVAAVERLLDIHQARARTDADDQQHHGDHAAERADGQAAELARAALSGLFAHRARRRFLFPGGRFPRRGGLAGRRGVLCRVGRAFAARLLHLQNGLRLLRAARGVSGRLRLGFLLFVSAGGRAAGIGNHPIRRILLGAHDDAHRLLRNGRGLGPASAAGRLAIICHGLHLLIQSKSGANPACVYDVILYHTAFCRLAQGFFARASREPARTHSLNGGKTASVYIDG